MTDLKASSLRALKLMDLTTLNDDDTNEKSDRVVSSGKNPGREYGGDLYLPAFLSRLRVRL